LRGLISYDNDNYVEAEDVDDDNDVDEGFYYVPAPF